MEKEERSWGSLLAELGFDENPREKGKKMVDEASQQIENPADANQKDKTEEINAVNKAVQSSVDPETPCTREGTEKLSDIFKSITSKKIMCKQLFKEDKPRTRLREKLQTEERIAQEGAREVVIIEDAASEGTINTAEDKYSQNMVNSLTCKEW